MYKFLVKLLKILLIGALAVLLVLLIFGIVLSLDWPLWTGIFMLAGVIGIILGIIFFKKLWLKQREKQFVNQVIDQDQAYIETLSEKDRKNSKELQDRWKEAVDTLRKSHLRKYGNPLYILPWYMIVGESGSGKTTAIQSARLTSPFAEISSTSGTSGTKNCDWWFFDNAILIDTAGRYTVPIDDARDSNEWQKFLINLKKFRKKEPLNGLVVTIAADKLIDGTPEALEASAKLVRRRIDELMYVLGAKFPVYILVTKCDLIQGMTQFCDQLDENGRNQAMGAVNNEISENIFDFIRQTIHSVAERLKDLRLLVFQKSRQDRSAPNILIFPEEFLKLKEGLAAFIKGAFQANPYQEQPIVRGLFFSSGKQEGTPYSHLLGELGLIEQKEVLPGTSKGLFLHDFFSKILPGDRGLFAPTQRRLEWRRLTRNIGLTAWLAILISICGLLSFSFVKNLSAIREISQEFQKPIVFQNDLMADTITMNQYLDAILRVEEKNENFWIPRLGLTESLTVERQLKKNFCRSYYKGFLKPFDNQTSVQMARISAATPDEFLGNSVAHLVRRINLIQAKLAGNDAMALSDLRQPVFDSFLGKRHGGVAIPDFGEKLSRLYWHYILWQSDSEALNEEMNAHQKWLKRLLTLPGINLNWLVDWVNTDTSIAPVLMSDFWGKAQFEEDISPAFTLDGKERIEILIKEIEDALYDPLMIAEKKLDFFNWYDRNYIYAWHDFASIFPTGSETLEDREAWRRIAARVGSEQDPYFIFFDKMAYHLTPYDTMDNRPAWIGFVYELQAAEVEAALTEKKDGIKDAGIIRKATRKVKSAVGKAERATGMRAAGSLDSESRMAAGKALKAYKEALSQITPAASSRKAAYQLAFDFYANYDEQEPGASPFISAYDQTETLKAVFSKPGKALTVMDELINGSVDFLQAFALYETACYLQNEWEKQVMLEVKDISGQNVNQLLMGESGFARKFIEGPAGPFIERSVHKGYYPILIKEKSIPFNESFLSYLNRGERAFRTSASTYEVVVRAEPTGVNKGARINPHETVVELKCDTGTTRLVNLNYPVSKSFAYSPERCDDVIITIQIGNLAITKSYTGYLAFPRFVNEFENSERRLYLDEFPEKAPALRRMGVEYFTMAFEFENHEPVLDFLSVAAEPVPESIAACWE